MAGDVFSAKAGYYYPAPVTNNSNPLISDIVTAFINAITGSPAASGVIHGGTSNISSDLNASVPFKTIADPHQTGSENIPRAYLNVMFFNERFEFVEEGSTALRVSQPGDGAAPLVIPSIKAPKNGYAFIYLSNENDDAVYFDDFTVSYTRGKIIEENHYYAFGLRISGISSRKYDGGSEGSLKNEFLYNDKELWEDANLDWYDYGFRNYDAQIARFTQLDPLAWDYPELTNYQYASNDPIANVDLDGLEKWSSIIDKSEFFLNKAGDIATEALAPAVITAKLPAAAKTVSFAAKAGALLKSAGTAAASFGKNFWNEDVTPSVTWFNRNLNPIYGIFNGINSQFTGQDFLTGEPMSRADGVGDVVLSAIPALKVEGAIVKGVEKEIVRQIEKVAAKGSTTFTKSSLQLGQQMHKGYKAGLADGVTTFKEFTGIKGIRPDFVDFGTKTIYELKPFNPRQIQLGTKQLNNYKSLFEQKYGGTWKTVLDHY